ncbi:MAG: 30S ribosomal protein S18 [Candidatus Pelagibacter sp.]|nr:30S ribosomal protein S18 [Candidatus Pelagibacter sp.]|tara:strand:+ start:20004 stop:20270 length:267 start_codon:yes stop_codon:yes gene_type:complete
MRRTKIKKKRSGQMLSKNLSQLKKACPLSGKNAPDINYKNLTLLKKYISDTSKILPTRITNVSHSKQKKLAKEIKKARSLALLPYVGY